MTRTTPSTSTSVIRTAYRARIVLLRLSEARKDFSTDTQQSRTSNTHVVQDECFSKEGSKIIQSHTPDHSTTSSPASQATTTTTTTPAQPNASSAVPEVPRTIPEEFCKTLTPTRHDWPPPHHASHPTCKTPHMVQTPGSQATSATPDSRRQGPGRWRNWGNRWADP